MCSTHGPILRCCDAGGRRNPAWITPVAEVDLRVGGRYRISMEDPESGKKYTAGGEYSEVSRPNRLVYSWQWEQEDGELGHASTVAVDFRGEEGANDRGARTPGFESLESRDSHGHGWEGVLEAFQTHLNGRAAQTS